MFGYNFVIKLKHMSVNQGVASSSLAWGATSFKSELFTGFGFFHFLSGEGCVWGGSQKKNENFVRFFASFL